MDTSSSVMLWRDHACDDALRTLHAPHHHVELRSGLPANSRFVRRIQIGRETETNFRVTCQIERVHSPHANHCARAHS